MPSVIRGSGTSSLGGDLDIEGVLTYEDVSSVDSVGVITARSGIDVGTGTSISSPSSNVLTLGTNNEERLRITSGGNVGIGTDNPSKKIDIRTDTVEAGIVLNSSGRTLVMTTQEQSGVSQAAKIGTTSNHELRIITNNTEQVRIESSGHIGISSVIGKNISDSFTLNGQYQPHYGINFNSTSTIPTGLSGYWGIAVATNGTERIRILNNGNIGIGTTIPSRPLVNAGAITMTTGAAPQFRLVATENATDTDDTQRAIFGLATDSAHFFPGAAAGDAILRATDGGDLLFGNGQNEKLRLESTGHLLGTAGARIVQEVLKAEWSNTPNQRIYELDLNNFTNSGTSVYYWFRINAWLDIGTMASQVSYDISIHKRSATAVDINVVKLTPWHSKALGFYHYTADAGTGDKRFVVYFGEDYSGFSVIDYTSNSGRMKTTKGQWSNPLNDSAAVTAIAGYTAVTPYEYSYT